MTILKHLRILVLAAATTLPVGAVAQSLFDTVIEVNNSAISRYELDQREKFFAAINRPGNRRALARESLIDDRLRMQAARDAGLSMTSEQLVEEMENFAGRANLTLAEFTAILNRQGVDQAALRDFVEPAILWRALIQNRFAGQGQISDAEIDRAISTAGPSGGLRVLISEIILFAPPPEQAAQRRVAERISQITSISQFSNEARARSVANSRTNGGRLPWTNLADLPPPLQPLIRNLRPGQVTQPLTVENAFILFQLRDLQETTPAQPRVSSVEYAELVVPTANLTQIAGRLDVCDDFYGAAKRAGIADFAPSVVPSADVPSDLAARLATLDRNEITTRQVSETHTQVVMLCGRVFEATESQSREDIGNDLRQRRLSSLADSYLAELRAAAKITVR